MVDSLGRLVDVPQNAIPPDSECAHHLNALGLRSDHPLRLPGYPFFFFVAFFLAAFFFLICGPFIVYAS
jgi:hypothetical protein